jgi:archaemetzincin
MIEKNWIPFFIILLLCSCGKNIHHQVPKEKEKPAIKLAILPLDGFDTGQMKMVGNELENFYGIEIGFLEPGNLPDSLKHPYKNRFNANKILQHLYRIKPKEYPFILGLTPKGIATVKGSYKEWGILGLGSCPGPTCIISTANMGKQGKRFNERLIKVSLHEMGHNFGLPHCKSGDVHCLMRDANGTIRTIDEEKKSLCKKCSGNLRSKGFKLKEFS